MQTHLIVELVTLIKKHIDKQNKYILIADSDTFKKLIVSYLPELIVYNYEITHTGEGVNQNSDGLIGTMIDYIFISGACTIFSITTYGHGSSFSKWCAETHSIPYTCLHLKLDS